MFHTSIANIRSENCLLFICLKGEFIYSQNCAVKENHKCIRLSLRWVFQKCHFCRVFSNKIRLFLKVDDLHIVDSLRYDLHIVDSLRYDLHIVDEEGTLFKPSTTSFDDISVPWKWIIIEWGCARFEQISLDRILILRPRCVLSVNFKLIEPISKVARQKNLEIKSAQCLLVVSVSSSYT